MGQFPSRNFCNCHSKYNDKQHLGCQCNIDRFPQHNHHYNQFSKRPNRNIDYSLKPLRKREYPQRKEHDYKEIKCKEHEYKDGALISGKGKNNIIIIL